VTYRDAESALSYQASRGQPPDHRFVAADFAAGGTECRPRILGIGADSGHHEHRSPRTRVATEARGWRSTFRRSIARLVPQPGQNTSSQGVPAISAARIVGDHSMSRLAASSLSEPGPSSESRQGRKAREWGGGRRLPRSVIRWKRGFRSGGVLATWRGPAGEDRGDDVGMRHPLVVQLRLDGERANGARRSTVDADKVIDAHRLASQPANLQVFGDGAQHRGALDLAPPHRRDRAAGLALEQRHELVRALAGARPAVEVPHRQQPALFERRRCTIGGYRGRIGLHLHGLTHAYWTRVGHHRFGRRESPCVYWFMRVHARAPCESGYALELSPLRVEDALEKGPAGQAPGVWPWAIAGFVVKL
jgi:hypothetical protein